MPTIFFLTILAICKQPSFIFRHTVSRRAVPVGELQRLNLSERRWVEGAPQFPSAAKWPVCKNQAAAEIGVENSNEIVDLHWADDFYQYPVAKKNISTTDTTRSSTSTSLSSWVVSILYCYYCDTSPNCGTITAVGWNRNYHVLYPSLDFCLSCKHSPAQTYVFLCVSQRHNNLHKVIHTDV